MADTAEITIENITASDADSVNLTGLLSDIGTFAIPEDFGNEKGWKLLGNLALQGLGKNFSGVSTGTEHSQSDDAKEKKKRRQNDSLILLDMARQKQELEKQIAEIKRNITRLEKYISGLKQENATLLKQLEHIKTKLDDNSEQQERIQTLIDETRQNYRDGLKGMLAPKTIEIVDRLEEIQENFVTIRTDIEDVDGPRRFIVYKDEFGDYYIKHPKTGENLLVEDLAEPKMNLIGIAEGKNFTMLEDIAYQESNGERRFGNEAAPGEIEWHNNDQKSFLEALPAGDTRNKIIGFCDNIRYQEIQKFKLITERKELLEKRAVLEKQLSNNNDKIRLSETELSEKRIQLEELQERLDNLNNRMNLLEEFSKSTAQYTQDTRKKLTTLYNKAAEMAKDGASNTDIRNALNELDETPKDSLANIAMQMFKARQDHAEVKEDVSKIFDATNNLENRHEQLQTHFGDSPSELTLAIVPDVLIEFGASWVVSEKVIKAWENPITHEEKPVYRDNETLKLYTYDEETGTRHEITDPKIVAELYKRATVDMELFMNETPDSVDPDNSFVDTLEDLLKADKLRTVAQETQAKAYINLQNAQAAMDAPTSEGNFPAARHPNAGELAKEFDPAKLDTQKTGKTGGTSPDKNKLNQDLEPKNAS